MFINIYKIISLNIAFAINIFEHRHDFPLAELKTKKIKCNTYLFLIKLLKSIIIIIIIHSIILNLIPFAEMCQQQQLSLHMISNPYSLLYSAMPSHLSLSYLIV